MCCVNGRVATRLSWRCVLRRAAVGCCVAALFATWCASSALSDEAWLGDAVALHDGAREDADDLQATAERHKAAHDNLPLNGSLHQALLVVHVHVAAGCRAPAGGCALCVRVAAAHHTKAGLHASSGPLRNDSTLTSRRTTPLRHGWNVIPIVPHMAWDETSLHISLQCQQASNTSHSCHVLPEQAAVGVTVAPAAFRMVHAAATTGARLLGSKLHAPGPLRPEGRGKFAIRMALLEGRGGAGPWAEVQAAASGGSIPGAPAAHGASQETIVTEARLNPAAAELTFEHPPMQLNHQPRAACSADQSGLFVDCSDVSGLWGIRAALAAWLLALELCRRALHALWS